MTPIEAPAGAWRSASEAEWARKLGVPRFEIHDEIDSTNERLHALAGEGVAPFTAVVARAQTRGRGRSGRAWHSAPDAGLWISVLLETEAPERPGVLTLAVGVATARAIESVSGGTASLKWPNDVFYRGRKVSGILCESSGHRAEGSGDRAAIVVGIGINLRRPAGLPAPLADTAGFLEEVGRRPVSEPELAGVLLEELRGWVAPAPTTMTGALRAEWEPRDHLAGRRIVLDDGATGVCRGIGDDGALRLEGEGGEVRWVRSGGVREVTPRGGRE